MNIAGAILSGGKNIRMGGRNKAFLRMGNSPIVQRTVGLLKEVFDEILLVTNSPEEYSSFRNECHIITDIIKDIGPLGGIQSALSHTTKEAVFFVACDMPFLHNELIRKQVDYFNRVDCDVLVPKTKSFIEPLHAIYRRTLKDSLECFINNNSDSSIRSFLETVHVCYWDVDEGMLNRNVFCNLNTPEDVERIKKDNGNENENLA